MAFDCELPNDERREMILLSRVYRARHSKGFRLKDEKVIGSSVDPMTGLVKSEADLLPEGEAIRGPQFALMAPIVVDELPLETLARNEVDGSTPLLKNVRMIGIQEDHPDPEHPHDKGITVPVLVAKYPTHERGRAEEELAHRKKNRPEFNPRFIDLQGRSALTEEESEAVAELLYAFQKTILAMADKGWVKLEPTLAFEPSGPASLPTQGDPKQYKRGVDDNGMPFFASWTPAGLDEAEKRIAGDPYWSQGAFSSLAGQTTEVKAAAVARNPWAHQKFLEEGGQS